MPPRFTSGIAFEQRRRARHSAGAPTYEVFFRSPPSFSEKLPNVNLGANASYPSRIVECHLDLHQEIAFEQRRRARHSAGAPTYEVFFRSPPSFSEKLPN